MFAIAEAVQPITGRGRRLQAVRPEAHPVDEQDRHAGGLPAAQDGARGGHHPVGVDRRRDPRAGEGGGVGRPGRLRPHPGQPPTAANSGTDSRCACEVWSEKGTVRGVLAPTLDKYGVGFRPVHGFSSATTVDGGEQRQRQAPAHHPLRRRLRPERHVHVRSGPAETVREVRRHAMWSSSGSH